MSTTYITAIQNSAAVKELFESGLAKIDKDDEAIVFALPHNPAFTINDLDLDIYSEGALVVVHDGRKYIFYLNHFGNLDKVEDTSTQLAYIVTVLAGVTDGEAYIDYRNSVSRLRLVIPKGLTVSSARTRPNSIADAIGWLFRLKPGIKSRRIL
jgi:hypothetical protein